MHGVVEPQTLPAPRTAAYPAACPVHERSAMPRAVLSERLQQRMAQEFQPRWEREWGGAPITHGAPPGPDAVRLDGNDYLGIGADPHIVRAQVAALEHAHGVVQSGVFQLPTGCTGALERALAAWVGHESAVVCQSGYAANLGLLQTVCEPGTPVYLDSLAHMSLWDGVRAAGAMAHAVRHNDPAHLARMIGRHGPGLVIVDALYSTTGAVCPLREVVQACEEGGCMLLVDESHSLGTHGPQGRGLCAALGLTDRVHFISSSLAKAFAGRAGLFTVPRELRAFLLSQSRPYIFSSGLLSHEVAGLHATLEVVRQADAARGRLAAHTRRLRAALAGLGYPIAHGSEQIIALEAGAESDTLRLRQALEQRGVVGAVFCAPATGRNRSMVRLTLHANLTDAELGHVEAVARAIAPLVKPWEWPIARRQARD